MRVFPGCGPRRGLPAEYFRERRMVVVVAVWRRAERILSVVVVDSGWKYCNQLPSGRGVASDVCTLEIF
jgi:hypothetical protein